MIIDYQTLMSDKQTVTGTAASTDKIYLGAVSADAAVGKGDIKELDMLVQVTTAFAGGTSVKATIQSDSTEAFPSPTTIQESEVVPTADLVAGYQFKFGTVPVNANEPYVRTYYTVVGTMSAGNITSAWILDRQTNNA